MTRIVTVVGARPQFIKAAPVSAALAAHGIVETLIHTGQHYDDAMSRRFFVELGIPEPAINLGIGSGSQAAQTGSMMAALEPVLTTSRPDWVVIYGDTNSTLAGALVAAKLDLPIAHVEAGLRSYNRKMPEEINRIVADSIATLLFAPTEAAARILRGEGHAPDQVVPSGDVMYDAALIFGDRARRESQILGRLGLAEKGFVLATLHRAENTDDPARLTAMMSALAIVARTIPVILPVHPRTRKALEAGGILPGPAVRLIDPLGYLDMARLTQGAKLVATDSGGLQKEAYFYRVPCVTLRTETEWTELVEAGWNRLAPSTSAEAVASVIADTLAAPIPRDAPDFYGTGDAAQKIAERLGR